MDICAHAIFAYIKSNYVCLIIYVNTYVHNYIVYSTRARLCPFIIMCMQVHVHIQRLFSSVYVINRATDAIHWQYFIFSLYVKPDLLSVCFSLFATRTLIACCRRWFTCRVGLTTGVRDGCSLHFKYTCIVVRGVPVPCYLGYISSPLMTVRGFKERPRITDEVYLVLVSNLP